MHITGEWNDAHWYGTVRLDGIVLDPAPSQRVANHSPDGFSWGYAGSGPSQLALAILLRVTDRATAVRHYRAFCREVLANVPSNSPLDVTLDVAAWLSDRLKLDI